jgi:3-hydroxyacyl-CoA dehydrogenase
MINEAVFALQEGVATAEAIDDGMKLGCSHPIGRSRCATSSASTCCSR